MLGPAGALTTPNRQCIRFGQVLVEAILLPQILISACTPPYRYTGRAKAFRGCVRERIPRVNPEGIRALSTVVRILFEDSLVIGVKVLDSRAPLWLCFKSRARLQCRHCLQATMASKKTGCLYNRHPCNQPVIDVMLIPNSVYDTGWWWWWQGQETTWRRWWWQPWWWRQP